MNIKVKASQGLQGEFNSKISAIYEQEIQKRVDAALKDVVDELVEEVEQEIEEMEAKHELDLEVVDTLYGFVLKVANEIINDQAKEIKDLKATLEEAEARIGKLAADKKDLMDRAHEVEMDNQELIRHIQAEEGKAFFEKIEAMEKKAAAAKKAEAKTKADPDPKAADPKAYESIDSLFKFLFGEVEDL